MVKSLLVGLVSVVPFCDPSGETLYRTGIIDIITTSVRHSGKGGKENMIKIYSSERPMV